MRHQEEVLDTELSFEHVLDLRRALCKSVVHRKVSGGFRSAWGAQAFATFATVLQTAQKQGHDIPTTALTSALLQASLPHSH